MSKPKLPTYAPHADHHVVALRRSRALTGRRARRVGRQRVEHLPVEHRHDEHVPSGNHPNPDSCWGTSTTVLSCRRVHDHDAPVVLVGEEESTVVPAFVPREMRDPRARPSGVRSVHVCATVLLGGPVSRAPVAERLRARFGGGAVPGRPTRPGRRFRTTRTVAEMADGRTPRGGRSRRSRAPIRTPDDAEEAVRRASCLRREQLGSPPCRVRCPLAAMIDVAAITQINVPPARKNTIWVAVRSSARWPRSAAGRVPRPGDRRAPTRRARKAGCHGAKQRDPAVREVVDIGEVLAPRAATRALKMLSMKATAASRTNRRP